MGPILLGARDKVIPDRILWWRHEDWVNKGDKFAICPSDSFHITLLANISKA